MPSSRQALIGELGRALQAYQRSTQAFDDEVGRVLDLNPADLEETRASIWGMDNTTTSSGGVG